MWREASTSYICGDIENTTIEVKLSAEKKDLAFSLIFIAGPQGHIVEVNEDLLITLVGIGSF